MSEAGVAPSRLPTVRSTWTMAGAIALSAVLLAGAQRDPGSRAADERAERPSVALIIDYGDGCEKHFPHLAWHRDMTVLDLLETARRHPHGVKIVYRGRGRTAFLERIDDLKNQGAGARNWIFSVNGKVATRGMGATTLQPGDRVVWQYRRLSD